MFLSLPGSYPYLGPQEAAVLLTPALPGWRGRALSLVSGILGKGKEMGPQGMLAAWLGKGQVPDRHYFIDFSPDHPSPHFPQ